MEAARQLPAPPQPGWTADRHALELALRRGLCELGGPAHGEVHAHPSLKAALRKPCLALGLRVVCDTRLDVDQLYLLCEPKPNWGDG